MRLSDHECLGLAREVASWSKDASSKVGAVLLSAAGAPLSFAYNGFCRGVDDDVPERSARPAKYAWTEHAERNALWNFARRSLAPSSSADSGLSMFVWGVPSPDAIRAVAQSGIRRLVLSSSASDGFLPGSGTVSSDILSESGVDVIAASPSVGDKWIDRFMSVAKRLASDDVRGSSSGAVIVDGARTPVSFGRSGFPDGLAEAAFWTDPLAGELSEEAAQGALLSSVRERLFGSSLYVTHFPCARCCRAIVQAGIGRVVVDEGGMTGDFMSRWADDVALSRKAFAAAGVALSSIRRNGPATGEGGGESCSCG
jgi:dCMP deaminase